MKEETRILFLHENNQERKCCMKNDKMTNQHISRELSLKCKICISCQQLKGKQYEYYDIIITFKFMISANIEKILSIFVITIDIRFRQGGNFIGK